MTFVVDEFRTRLPIGVATGKPKYSVTNGIHVKSSRTTKQLDYVMLHVRLSMSRTEFVGQETDRRLGHMLMMGKSFSSRLGAKTQLRLTTISTALSAGTYPLKVFSETGTA